MDQGQIERIRDSFTHVLYDRATAASYFYDTLFARAPETRALFPASLAAQGSKLIETLALVVTGLSRFDDLQPVLADLAVRHVGYGAEEAHYALVGDALLAMLRHVSGSAFTPETEAAWGEAYAAIATTMIDAAREMSPR